MNKIRIAVDVVALCAACVGLAAAYVQTQKANETIEVSQIAQQKLENVAQSGGNSLKNINSVIVDLGRITGQDASPITKAEFDNAIRRAATSDCDKVDKSPSANTLSAAFPPTKAARSEGEKERLAELRTVQFSNGKLQATLTGIRNREDGRLITVTTEFKNLSSERIYIGKLNKNDQWFAASSSGQKMNLNEVDGIPYDKYNAPDNVSLQPGQVTTVVWYVRPYRNQIEPGVLELRGTFVVHRRTQSENVQVQLRGIDLNWGIPASF
ncbi:MAG: hypothetical protein R3E09_11385 [Novosphingobium sp.]